MDSPSHQLDNTNRIFILYLESKSWIRFVNLSDFRGSIKGVELISETDDVGDSLMNT